jgi:hypothetical protein
MGFYVYPLKVCGNFGAYFWQWGAVVTSTAESFPDTTMLRVKRLL